MNEYTVEPIHSGTRTENLNVKHRREGNPGYSIQVILKDDNAYDHALLTIDVFEPKNYRTGMERITACVWFHDSTSNIYLSGSGYAGGCGYHKPSAAINAAFNSAGIDCDSFSGHGDSAVKDTIYALMTVQGYDRSDYVLAWR